MLSTIVSFIEVRINTKAEGSSTGKVMMGRVPKQAYVQPLSNAVACLNQQDPLSTIVSFVEVLLTDTGIVSRSTIATAGSNGMVIRHRMPKWTSVRAISHAIACLGRQDPLSTIVRRY